MILQNFPSLPAGDGQPENQAPVQPVSASAEQAPPQSLPKTPPAPPAAPESRRTTLEITLPFCGKKAQIRRSDGYDMQQAIRLASVPEEQGLVIAANVTMINGLALTYETFLGLDSSDIAAILTSYHALMGN